MTAVVCYNVYTFLVFSLYNDATRNDRALGYYDCPRLATCIDLASIWVVGARSFFHLVAEKFLKAHWLAD
jgi:hypothetical protein